MFENMSLLVNRAPWTSVWVDWLYVRSSVNLSVILLRRELGGESVLNWGQKRRRGTTDITPSIVTQVSKFLQRLQGKHTCIGLVEKRSSLPQSMQERAKAH